MAKKYVKQLLLVVLLLAAAGGAQAQKNFRPGYIVRPGGDTLRGEVDARGGQRMASLCLFRPAAGAGQVRYTPSDLKSYGFKNGARYETNQLPATAGAAGGGPVLFLQVVAQGKATLYTFTDEGDHVRYFFRVAGGNITELLQTTKLTDNNYSEVRVQQYPFRNVLSQAFVDCPAVQHLLVNAELTEAKLGPIFDRYNTCGPAQVASVKSQVRRTTLHVGLLAGVQSATMNLNDGGDVTVKSGSRPVFGLGLLINPGSFNEKLALRVELLYQTQVHSGDYLRKYGPVGTLNSNRKADITLNTLRIPLMLRYTLPKGAVRPYIQVGGEVAALLDTHQAYIIETNQALGGTGTTTNVREIEMRGLGIGATGAVGVVIPAGPGAIQLEARYNQLDSSAQEVGLLGGAQTVFFLLGYNFGR